MGFPGSPTHQRVEWSRIYDSLRERRDDRPDSSEVAVGRDGCIGDPLR
jgi:hypothetical protein